MKQVEDLETLCELAMQMSERTTNRQVTAWQIKEASLIFAKQVMTCISLLRLIPASTYFSPAKGHLPWDLSSVATLTRNIIETYLTLFYLAVENVDQDERAFRELYWHFQEDSERYEMMQTALPGSQQISALLARLEEARGKVKKSAFFKALHAKRQAELMKARDCRIVGYSRLSEHAGISRQYHRAEYKYCSNFAHTSALSISQLDAFRAGAPEAATMLGHLAQLAANYMAIAIRDYATLFPDQKDSLGPIRETLEVCLHVLKWEHPTNPSN